ncbi:MAG TPA: transcription-repair coupling factor, partial [Treponemataceae bacterium]|nr:transcription-repair coupling factor [Treponemataceae bacterium]
MTVSSLKKAIHQWPEMTDALARLDGRHWPYEIEGAQGGLLGFFLAEYVERIRGRILVVVPTEKELEALRADLDLAGLDAEVLPWWGTIAYRPAPVGFLVFGQRVARLAALLDGQAADAGRVLAMTQRAFLTPVPPPEYLRSLLFPVKKGDRFDPAELAERLARAGYTRVPRVTVHGEFALRGEVLDVFMPGEAEAHRITFDFDAVEHIRSFDPATQSSTGSVDSLAVYPMREVVWTEALVAALEA